MNHKSGNPKIWFSVFKELFAAASCLDFPQSRHLSSSLALTLLQSGLPTEHKASLLTRNDLSLVFRVLTILIPTQNLNHVQKSRAGREVETLCTRWSMHELNLSLQISTVLLTHGCKTFNTVIRFKLYEVHVKENNFKKIVNIRFR